MRIAGVRNSTDTVPTSNNDSVHYVQVLKTSGNCLKSLLKIGLHVQYFKINVKIFLVKKYVRLHVNL